MSPNIDVAPLLDSKATASEIIVLPKEINREDVKIVVKEYFNEDPILITIAWCESRFRQYDNDGSIHRGDINNRDVGVMQINEFYHLEQALKQGIDIYSLKGNLAYAKHLYDKQGTAPWNSSSKCWRSQQVAKI